MLFGKRNIQKWSDDELLKEFYRSGDQQYFAALYQRLIPLVFGTCMKYLKNEAKAKDASMDIFEHCVKKIRQNEITHFKSWLYVVVKNHCLMILRKESKVRFVEFDTENNNLSESNGYDFLLEEKLQKLSSVLKNLKEDQKVCIEMFFLKNKCYQEIADELNMDIKKVKSHIQNGKRNLKILLSKEEIFKDKV